MLADFCSGSGEKDGKEVKAGSSSSSDLAEALEPCLFGIPRSVLDFFCSVVVEACEVWEEERRDKLLPLSDMLKPESVDRSINMNQRLLFAPKQTPASSNSTF